MLHSLKGLPKNVIGWQLISETQKNSPLICVGELGDEVIPFWNPKTINWNIRVKQNCIKKGISLWDYPCRKYILRTACATYIQLHIKGFLLQLECPVTFNLSSPLYLDAVINIGENSDNENSMGLLDQLLRMMGNKEFQTNDLEENRMCECLLAIQEWDRNKSYREVAVILWGKSYVDENWNGGQGFLKDRVRNRVRKGQYYQNYGYRDLLLK